ncbi:hypothetical protein FisN_13Lh074 [Fistulifera solaris]|uniref:SUN domain-containing protein n=1 Tax=Fistulifera solaris TaxID=1519565 RepID=A0A1Z5JF33_FISSO|nr:hypothetical protein FisN_13Lh074 [Fistulifera solaris]|eukprot:GAX12613.1 hypothetical protein FisN_13Lh074 [Fistulifera solaris]
MPTRTKPVDEEDTTSSKKRKSLHEDAAAAASSDVGEVNAPPKKKRKESNNNYNKKNEEAIILSKKTRLTPSRSAVKRSKAAPSPAVENVVTTDEIVTSIKEKNIFRSLRVENLKIPSHQTPGKYPVKAVEQFIETETKITRPPQMRLHLGETVTEDLKIEKETRVQQEETTKEEITMKENKQDPISEKTEETTKVAEAAEPIWTNRNFWMWGMMALHLLALYHCGSVSNYALSFYKSLFGTKVKVSVREISPLEMEATERLNTQLQLLDFNMARLNKGRDVLFADLPGHQQLVARLSELMDLANAPWTDRFEESIRSVEKLIAEDQTLSTSTIASIRDLLGEEASEYLLDLRNIKLWNISTNVTECGQRESLTEGRVLDAQRQLLLDLQEETSKLVNDERVKNAVIEWIRQDTAKRFEGPIEVPSTSNQPRGSNLDSIRKAIQSRMDIVAADLTGKVDYAAISSGGVIIKTGKYATTSSIVDTLPYGNRLLHMLRLRFYGHGPEAAIMPTYPFDPSQALGNCWAFVATPSELGKYAVFSVSLANPIYATQVAIEHPPREVNDRAKAAIRSFRVVGFESADATGKAWDMGQFEYRLGDDYLQVFDLEEEMGDADIPAIQSLSLLIDSNWGLGYSCLYRLRVHGHNVDNES